MVAVFIFIFALVSSFIIVRIGAIAFQLTGLEWSLAKFQALSCFSGTGFTTRESELITRDKQRRKIASILMVLGNAGLVTMIASVAGAFAGPAGILPKDTADIYSVLVNLAMLIILLYIFYRIAKNRKFRTRITNFLRKKIMKREAFQNVSFEELLFVTGGYGISKFRLTKDSPLAGKTLLESDLRKNDITILAIIKGDDTIPNPPANSRLEPGNEVVAYGNTNNMRKNFVVTSS
jgi:hypothetical protein